MFEINYSFIGLTYILDLQILLLQISVSSLWLKNSQYTINIRTIIKNIPVKVYHSISIVKYYYGPLPQIYSIINNKILGIKLELALYMSFKTINDLVGPNKLVPTLLVFGIYLRMTELNVLSPLIIQRGIAMKKAIDEIQKCTIS